MRAAQDVERGSGRGIGDDLDEDDIGVKLLEGPGEDEDARPQRLREELRGGARDGAG